MSVIPAALISAEEFALAQTRVSGLTRYVDYDDWFDDRLGIQMGLGMAGIHVELITVSLGSFLIWCRRTATCPSEEALEHYAAVMHEDVTVNRLSRPSSA